MFDHVDLAIEQSVHVVSVVCVDFGGLLLDFESLDFGVTRVWILDFGFF